MKFINTRKFTWIICIIGFLLALVSIFFLPSIIPVHFANGIADDYGRGLRMIMEEKYKYFYFLYYKCLSLF